MVKFMLLALFVAILLAVIWLVIANRDSEQVLSAAVPLAFGTASALALVFGFAKPGNIERVFPAVFMVDRSERLPVTFPGRPFPDNVTAFATVAKSHNPQIFDDPGTPFLSNVYHELLQRAIIDVLALRHFGAWRVEKHRFDSGQPTHRWGEMADAQSFAKVSLTVADVKAILAGNRFASYDAFGSPGTLVLPPGTQLIVSPPSGDQIKRGFIRFTNYLCELNIETTQSMSGAGLGGYALIAGLDGHEAQDKYFTTEYVVKVTTAFSRWRLGDPSMTAYREWAEGIIDELEHNFDDQLLWRHARDRYLFQQHLPSRHPSPYVGPAHVSPPPSSPAPTDEAKKEPASAAPKE